ncbi:hypothetical protein FOCC_FOCC004497 [Frankliniella occidentalis]|nr:hypothetical protein FOCC_FOCC004497 [Frankliniella occidentalis]
MDGAAGVHGATWHFLPVRRLAGQSPIRAHRGPLRCRRCTCPGAPGRARRGQRPRLLHHSWHDHLRAARRGCADRARHSAPAVLERLQVPELPEERRRAAAAAHTRHVHRGRQAHLPAADWGSAGGTGQESRRRRLGQGQEPRKHARRTHLLLARVLHRADAVSGAGEAPPAPGRQPQAQRVGPGAAPGGALRVPGQQGQGVLCSAAHLQRVRPDHHPGQDHQRQPDPGHGVPLGRPPGLPQVTVRLGEHDARTEVDCSILGNTSVCAPPAVDVRVEEVISHPEYVKSTRRRDGLWNDIALLRLARPVEFTRGVAPVCLPNDMPRGQAEKDQLMREQKGFTFTVVGWGRIGKDEDGESRQRLH